MPLSESDETRLARAAEALADAYAERDAAVLAARANGGSWREIASHVGLTFAGVRKIVGRYDSA